LLSGCFCFMVLLWFGDPILSLEFNFAGSSGCSMWPATVAMGAVYARSQAPGYFHIYWLPLLIAGNKLPQSNHNKQWSKWTAASLLTIQWVDGALLGGSSLFYRVQPRSLMKMHSARILIEAEMSMVTSLPLGLFPCGLSSFGILFQASWQHGSQLPKERVSKGRAPVFKHLSCQPVLCHTCTWLHGLGKSCDWSFIERRKYYKM
jgi:hypothetical protein